MPDPVQELRSLKWKWKSLSRVWLFVTPWIIQSMEFSRPGYWSGQPFLSPGDLPNPEIEPRSPTLQEDSLPAEPQGKPKNPGVGVYDTTSVLCIPPVHALRCQSPCTAAMLLKSRSTAFLTLLSLSVLFANILSWNTTFFQFEEYGLSTILSYFPDFFFSCLLGAENVVGHAIPELSSVGPNYLHNEYPGLS